MKKVLAIVLSFAFVLSMLAVPIPEAGAKPARTGGCIVYGPVHFAIPYCGSDTQIGGPSGSEDAQGSPTGTWAEEAYAVWTCSQQSVVTVHAAASTAPYVHVSVWADGYHLVEVDNDGVSYPDEYAYCDVYGEHNHLEF